MQLFVNALKSTASERASKREMETKEMKPLQRGALGRAHAFNCRAQNVYQVYRQMRSHIWTSRTDVSLVVVHFFLSFVHFQTTQNEIEKSHIVKCSRTHSNTSRAAEDEMWLSEWVSEWVSHSLEEPKCKRNEKWCDNKTNQNLKKTNEAT